MRLGYIKGVLRVKGVPSSNKVFFQNNIWDVILEYSMLLYVGGFSSNGFRQKQHPFLVKGVKCQKFFRKFFYFKYFVYISKNIFTCIQKYQII